MPRDDNPETVLEVLDDAVRFRPTTFQAVKAFAESRPWQGSLEERIAKFRKVNHDLAVAYHVPEPQLVFGRLDGGSSDSSFYDPTRHQIVLNGKLSVVTFLHEFAHARGMGEVGACRWSIILCRRCFPQCVARLVGLGRGVFRRGGGRGPPGGPEVGPQ